MKGTIIGLTTGGVGGFITGCLMMQDGNVGSMVLGVVMALLVVIVLGAIGILFVGVLTRNMRPERVQRQPDYPQTPYIMLGGPSQPQPAFGEPSTYHRQLPLMDRKQVEYEDF